jgi:hypothetical protein
MVVKSFQQVLVASWAYFFFAAVAHTPCPQQQLQLLVAQPLLCWADLVSPSVCVPYPMATVEVQQGPRLLVELQVTSWRMTVAVANLAAESQERILALLILEKSFSHPSPVLSEQVDGLAGNLADVVELDDLDRLCGSRRILLCRTLGCALSCRQQTRAIHD